MSIALTFDPQFIKCIPVLAASSPMGVSGIRLVSAAITHHIIVGLDWSAWRLLFFHGISGDLPNGRAHNYNMYKSMVDGGEATKLLSHRGI